MRSEFSSKLIFANTAVCIGVLKGGKHMKLVEILYVMKPTIRSAAPPAAGSRGQAAVVPEFDMATRNEELLGVQVFSVLAT